MTTDADDDLLRGEIARLLSHDGGLPPERALAEASFDRALWTRLFEAGYLATLLPEDAGGLGLSFAEACVIAEELGAVGATVPFTPTLCTLSVIARRADRADADVWIGRALETGVIATAAVFEPGDGGLPPDRRRFSPGGG